MNPLERAAMCFDGGKYCAPGETVVPGASNGDRFALVIAIGGDCTVSAYLKASIDDLPATFIIPEGVDYPIKFSSISVDAGSAGGRSQSSRHRPGQAVVASGAAWLR